MPPLCSWYEPVEYYMDLNQWLEDTIGQFQLLKANWILFEGELGHSGDPIVDA